jgi:integrase
MSPRPRQTNRDLPACMYQKHGAYWLVKGGKWRRLGKDKRSALIAYAKLTAPASGAMDGLIDSALSDIETRVRASTAKQYRYAATVLKRKLTEFEPSQVTMADVAAIKRDLRDTPNMANRCLSFLRQVFNYAVEDGIVPGNPCIGIGRHSERKRSRLLTLAELDGVRKSGSERLCAYVDLLAGTGQRPVDVLGIRRTDLTDEGIRFKQAKTGAQLVVRWTPEIKEATDRALALHGKVAGFYLFRTRKGGKPAYKTMYDEWRRACKKAGVADADLRDLRALAATEAKRQSLNPTALLGHKSTAMTDRYLRDKEVPVVDGPRIRRLIDTK